MTPLKYLLEVTMEAKMSGSTRRELLSHTRKRYINASWRKKAKILDGCIALTGYDRKYDKAILRWLSKFGHLVNSLTGVSSRRLRKKKYPAIIQNLWECMLWSPSYFARSNNIFNSSKPLCKSLRLISTT